MAVIGVQETYESRSLSGALRESLKYERSFVVQVDTLATPLLDIALAPGVKLGDFHPESNYCICQSYNVTHRGGAALLYNVRFSYDIFKDDGAATPTFSQLPAPKWTGGTALTQQGVFLDRTGKKIVNSAGAVLPDVEMDVAEATLTLVRCYPSTGFTTMQQAIANLTNTVNNGTWAGGAAKTWKCQGAKWQRMVEGDQDGKQFVYYETTWEFAYRGITWELRPLDIGLAQKVDNNGAPSKTGTKRAAIIGEDGKPIKEPAPLDGGIEYTGAVDGVTWPKVLAYDLYVERDFTTSFGTPS